MRSLGIALVVLACNGCPKPPPPVPTPLDATVTACPASAAQPSAGECKGLFTADSRACWRCTGAEGCVDPKTMIYCVKATCTDPACHYEQSN